METYRSGRNGAGDALTFFQENKAVLYPQEQKVFKNCHIHMFFKKSAAFVLAYIYMGCHIVKGDVLTVILLNKRDNVSEPLQMLLRLLLFFRQA